MIGDYNLAALRPGDLFFGPIGGSAGAIVGLGQVLVAPWKHQLTWRRWWKVRHCGVITQAASEGYESRSYRTPSGNPCRWTRGIAPRLAQAEPGGMEEIEVDPDRHWTSEYVYLRPAYPGGESQAWEVAAMSQLMVNAHVPYAFEDYAAILAHRLHLPIPHLDRFIAATRASGLPKRAMCSQAVDAVLSLSGGLDGHGNVFNDGRLPQDVVPSELYLRLLDLGPELVIVPGKMVVKAGPGGSIHNGAQARLPHFRDLL